LHGLQDAGAGEDVGRRRARRGARERGQKGPNLGIVGTPNIPQPYSYLSARRIHPFRSMSAGNHPGRVAVGWYAERSIGLGAVPLLRCLLGSALSACRGLPGSGALEQWQMAETHGRERRGCGLAQIRFETVRDPAAPAIVVNSHVRAEHIHGTLDLPNMIVQLTRRRGKLAARHTTWWRRPRPVRPGAHVRCVRGMSPFQDPPAGAATAAANH
jgi:hypothetical protein